MVDIRIQRHGQEVLAAAPPKARTTRFAIETLHDQQADSAANLIVQRHGQEVIAQVPPAARTTRFAIETVHDQQADAAAQLIIQRHGQEVIGEQPPVVSTTRFAIETVHDQQADAAAQLIIQRHGQEILARRFIQLTACNIPDFWRYFSHNFVDEFVLETLYRTAVSRGADTLSEDRTQMFERPRRTMTIRWSEKGLDDKRNLMDLIQAIRQFKTNEWMIPLAPDMGCINEDATALTSTIKGDFTLRRLAIGGRVAVVTTVGDRSDVQNQEGDMAGIHISVIQDRPNFDEIVLQDALPFDISAGRAFIVPLVCVHPRLIDDVGQHHGRLWDIKLEFEEVGGPTAIPPTADDLPDNFDSYRDSPIFRPRHDYSNPLNIQILQDGDQEELGRGKGTYTRGDSQRVKHRIRMFEEREKGWDYLRFFDTRRGRLRPFWLIDQEDLFVVSSIDPNFIDVAKLGTLTEFEKDGQFFGFMMKDGTCYAREVLSVTDLPAAWRLNMVDLLPSGLDANDVVLAGRVRHTRMLNDSFVERWFHGNAVAFDVETISLLEEKDVTIDP